LHPSQYSSFLETLWPSLIFKHWILLLVNVSLFAICNFKYLNFPHIIMQKCFPFSFCHIILRRFAIQDLFSKR
jgi:hypothetical protein